MQWHQDVHSARRSTRLLRCCCRWQWFTRRSVIAAVLLTAAAPTVADDESLANLLDLAPAESDVLVIVPDMAALAEQLGMFESQIGLGMPELSNVLAQFQRTTGLTKGVKEDGPAMLAVTLEREDGVVTSVRTLLMIAAGDYAALARDLGVKDHTAVAAVQLATGHAANIKQQGEFAVLTSKSATLEAYQPAGQSQAILDNLGSLGQDGVSASHVAIVVHGSDVAGTLGVMTNMFAEAAMQFIAAQTADPAPTEGEPGDPAAAEIGASGGGGLGGAGGGVGAAMAAAWSQQDMSTNAADDMLHDAQSMVFALEFNDRGISLSQSTQFKSGSDAANALGEGRSASESMARLPQWPYMGAVAMSFKGVDLQALGDSSGRALVASVLSDWVWQTVSNKQNKPAVTSVVQVLYEPKDVSLGGAQSMTWLQTEDPEALVTALRQTLDQVNAGDEAGSGDGDDDVTADYTATYTPNHMKLDKYTVDQYIISPRVVQLGSGNAMTMASAMVGVAAGGDTSGFVVALDDGVIITKTTDTTVLEPFIEALGSEQHGLSDDLQLTESRHQLFEDSSIEAYLNMRSIYDAVRQNPMIGLILNQQLPQPDESMTPIAFGLKVSQGSTSARLYVPHLVIDYANQVVQQMLAAQTGQPGQPGGRGSRRGPGMFRP